MTMARKKIIAGGIVGLIIAVSLFIFLDPNARYNIYELLGRPQEGELNLTVIPEKTHMKEKELDVNKRRSFYDLQGPVRFYLVLTNVGDKRVNVVKLKEQISYRISLSYPNGTEVPYECGYIMRLPLGNEDLAGLPPGQSLFVKEDFHCWNLTEGEYLLSARYHVSGERFTKPHWIGVIKADPVRIVVE